VNREIRSAKQRHVELTRAGKDHEQDLASRMQAAESEVASMERRKEALERDQV
jgi:hypothetical protein